MVGSKVPVVALPGTAVVKFPGVEVVTLAVVTVWVEFVVAVVLCVVVKLLAVVDELLATVVKALAVVEDSVLVLVSFRFISQASADEYSAHTKLRQQQNSRIYYIYLCSEGWRTHKVDAKGINIQWQA